MRSPTYFFLATYTVIFSRINLKFHVSFKDFISATIKHQYTDDKTKEDI